MDEQRSAVISDSANISSSPINPPQAQVREGAAFSKVRYGFPVVRLVLGGLLLTTAALKLIDPSPDTFSALELLSSPRWQMAAIEVEALLGAWLLTGAFPLLLWLAALLCFALLASVSLYLGIEGQSSCGCFGAKLPVSPWYAMGLDFAALTALIGWRPHQGYRSDSATMRRILAVAAGTGVILALGFGGLTWMYGSPYEGLWHVRGESITLEPIVSLVGDGLLGEEHTFNIQLTNHRDRPIKVIGGTANCSCLATNDLPIIVQQKESRSITVRMNFRGNPGRFRHSFVLYTDEEEQATVAAWFTGRVIASPTP